MKRIIIGIFLILFAIIGPMELKASADQMMAFLPKAGEMGDWKPKGEPQYVEGEDLFHLINGGAEVYHEYGFKQAVTVSYENGSQSFNLELYQMNNPQSAYGIYTFKTGENGTPVQTGDAALLEDYYLNVRKGSFLITVIGFDSKPETLKTLREAATVTAGKIKEKGADPEILYLLPTEFKDQIIKVTYLKGNLALYNSYEFDTKDLFALKEGVYVQYRQFRLLMFKYDDASESNRKFQEAADVLSTSSRFANFKRTGNTISMTDKKSHSVSMENYKRYIITVITEPGSTTDRAAAHASVIKELGKYSF